jgi:hypothetical protein
MYPILPVLPQLEGGSESARKAYNFWTFSVFCSPLCWSGKSEMQQAGPQQAWTWSGFGRFVGTVAVLFGLYKNYVALEEMNKRQADQAVLDWQHPEVFRLIADTGRKGIEFDTLKFKYWATAAYQHLALEKRDEVELRRILISLISKNAIVPLGDDRFRIRSESELCGAQNSASDILNNLGPQALAYIDKYSGTANSQQWVQTFAKQYHLEAGEAQLLLAGLVSNRWVGVHRQNGTVWNVVTHPEMQDQLQITPVVYYSPCGGYVRSAEGVRPTPRPASTPPPGEAYPQVLPEDRGRRPINQQHYTPIPGR